MQLMLSALLLLLASSSSASAANINFAIVWDNEGIATIAENLFNRIFLPDLRNSCQSVTGFNETIFQFFEIPQKHLYDLKLANEQITKLKAQKCLFIGAQSRPEVAQLRTSSIASGVPDLTEFAQVHEFATLPAELAADGIYESMSIAFQANATSLNTIAIIIGAGYKLRSLRNILADFPGHFFTFQLASGNEQQVLQRVKATGARNLLLMAPAQIAEAFLTAAFGSRMLEPNYRWFFYNSRLVDKNNFEGFRVISENITSMEFGPIATAISNNLTLAREIYLFDLLSVWQIYLKKSLCRQAEAVNQTYTGMTGNFNLFPNASVSRQDWTMYFYRGLGNERQRIGNWSSSGTFHFTPPKMRIPTEAVLQDELRKNEFRVVTILKPPYVQFKRGFENMANVSLRERLEGMAIDVCNEVIREINLTEVTFYFQEAGKYGSELIDGSWDGAIGDLITGKADLACLTMSPLEARSRVVRFSDPFLSFQLSILYKKQVQNPLNYMFQFLQPFHIYTWIGVIGSVLVLAVVLSVLHQISRNAVSFSLYDSIFFSFASLIQGITGTPPDRPSGQLVISVYWLFAFVVLVAYVTNYAARRSLDRLQSDITSLESLLSQSTHEYGTTAGSSYLFLFENSTITTRQQIYRHMLEAADTRLPPNVSTALTLVQNASYAFIYENPINVYYSQLICDAVAVGTFGSDSATFGMPISAEYQPMVSRIINRIIATGQMDILYNKYFKLTAIPNCRSTKFPDLLRDYIPVEPAFFNTKSGALTLNNTLGIAVINIVGSVLTLLLALVEWVVERCLRWRRERKERRLADDVSTVMSTGMQGESSA